MQRFMDQKGRRYEVVISPASTAAVHSNLGLNLPALLSQGQQPLAALLDDPPLLAAVLYALCSAQAAGITPQEFTACVMADPDVAADAAAAFAQELFDVHAPGAELVVHQTSRFDRALKTRMDKGTRSNLKTTIPTPPDPSIIRHAGPDKRRRDNDAGHTG